MPNGIGTAAYISTNPTGFNSPGGGTPGGGGPVGPGRGEPGGPGGAGPAGGGFTQVGSLGSSDNVTASSLLGPWDFSLNGPMTLGLLDYSNGFVRALEGGGNLTFWTGAGNAVYHSSSNPLHINIVSVQLASTTEFNIDSGPASPLISAHLYGNGGLIKNGAGSLFLSGYSEYRGDTTINNGFLVLQNQLTDQGFSSAIGLGNVTMGDAVFYLDSIGVASTNRNFTLNGANGFIGLVNTSLTLNGGITGPAPANVRWRLAGTRPAEHGDLPGQDGGVQIDPQPGRGRADP